MPFTQSNRNVNYKLKNEKRVQKNEIQKNYFNTPQKSTFNGWIYWFLKMQIKTKCNDFKNQQNLLLTPFHCQLRPLASELVTLLLIFDIVKIVSFKYFSFFKVNKKIYVRNFQ